jgi:hypothetical protein
LLNALVSKAQEYPKNYFSPPLDTPLIITGTFGEIRENHFHSGIDLSTNEQEGVPVMAAAVGYVSRIKVAPDGYGKAVYITHPNGYVTVYGHLQKFAGPLYLHVYEYQYQNKTFEFDIFPEKNKFPVNQRDIIGYSGSSGSAEGPHLHFEIRDEKTEEPINPMLFNIRVKDNTPPQIMNVRIYPLNDNGILFEADTAITYWVQKDSTNTRNILNTSGNANVYGNISFGFSAVDYPDSIYNEPDSSLENESDYEYEPNELPRLGIYSSELYVDNVLTYSSRFDRFNFNDTRLVNAHIDYLSKKRDFLTIERCHRLTGNNLSFYGGLSENGFSFFGQDALHEIRIVVKDFNGNQSEIKFDVEAYYSLNEKIEREISIDGFLVSTSSGLAITKSKYELAIPEGAVFQNFYFQEYTYKNSGFLSDVYRIGDPYEALRTPFTIGLKPNVELEDRLKSKAVIVRIDDYGELKSCGGEWNEKFLKAQSNYFGDFSIALDTIVPVVEKYYVPADMNNMYGGEVRILVKDELSGIKSYEGMIDGKWHLFEYDKKSDLLIANVDTYASGAEHTIEITVTDKMGNKAVWKSSFYF